MFSLTYLYLTWRILYAKGKIDCHLLYAPVWDTFENIDMLFFFPFLVFSASAPASVSPTRAPPPGDSGSGGWTTSGGSNGKKY